VNKKHAMPNSAVIAADPITGIARHDELHRSPVTHSTARGLHSAKVLP